MLSRENEERFDVENDIKNDDDVAKSRKRNPGANVINKI